MTDAGNALLSLCGDTDKEQDRTGKCTKTTIGNGHSENELNERKAIKIITTKSKTI